MTNAHFLEVRERVLQEAKTLRLLDAALLIIRFNKSTNSAHTVPDILPSEVFGQLDEGEYQDASVRVTALLSMTGRVGAAFHKYDGAEPLETEVAAMKLNHPGFSEKSYEVVVWDGAVAMR